MIDLSIIIPVHNEAKRLTGCMEKIIYWIDKHQHIETEIIFVENGSTDNTTEIIASYANRYNFVRAYVLRARGKGAAVRYGMLEATGRYRFMADCDWSMPITGLDIFLDYKSHDYILIGDRSLPGSTIYNEPLYRRLMGKIFNALVQEILPGVTDSQCGFKLFPGWVANDLFQYQTIPGMSFDIEILHIARVRGYNIQPIAISWYFDSDSRVRLIDDTLSMIKDVLSIKRNTKMGLYYVSEHGM